MTGESVSALAFIPALNDLSSVSLSLSLPHSAVCAYDFNKVIFIMLHNPGHYAFRGTGNRCRKPSFRCAGLAVCVCVLGWVGGGGVAWTRHRRHRVVIVVTVAAVTIVQRLLCHR